MGCCTGRSTKKSRLLGTDENSSPSQEKDEVNKKVDLIFQKYDTDGKGVFTKEEFRQILKSSLIRDNKTMSEPVLDRMIEMIDTNGNGLIERKEIIEFYNKCK